MYHKKSMRIFWLSLCLLLASGALIIAVVQINSHKKETERNQSVLQGADASDTTADAGIDAQPDQAGDAPVTLNGKQAAPEQKAQPVGGSLSEYTYELKAVGGYLEVYYYHTDQLFFHTGIPERALTDAQRQTLSKGKYFKDEQELYGYLESCTS